MTVAAWTARALQSIIRLRRSARTQRNFDFKEQLEIAELYLLYLYGCYQHWSMYYGRYHKNCNAYGCIVSFKRNSFDLQHMIIHDKCNQLSTLKDGCHFLCEFIVNNHIPRYPQGDLPLQLHHQNTRENIGAFPIFSPVTLLDNHASHNNFQCYYNKPNCTLRTLCKSCKYYIHNLFTYKEIWLPPYTPDCNCKLGAMSWQCAFCAGFLNDLLNNSGCEDGEGCTLNNLCERCVLEFNLDNTGIC